MLIRFIFALLTALVATVSIVRADSIKVLGVLFDEDGKVADGYVVKLVVGNPKILIQRDTTKKGLFEMTNDSVDPETLDQWYIICVPPGKIAEENVVFSQEGNKWVARVNLYLTSMRQKKYSRNVAKVVISQYTVAQSLLAMSGEITENEANELISSETAQVLRRTELGINPGESLDILHNEILEISDRSLIPSAISNKDYFVTLRENPKYRDFNPEIDPVYLRDPAPNSQPQIRRPVNFAARPGETPLPGVISFSDLRRKVFEPHFSIPKQYEKYEFRPEYFPERPRESLIGNYTYELPWFEPSGVQLTYPRKPRALVWNLERFTGRPSEDKSIGAASPGTWRLEPGIYPPAITESMARRFSADWFNVVQNRSPDYLPVFSHNPVRNFDTVANVCLYQRCTLNGEGRIIVLKNDGTWLYLEQAQPLFRFGARFTF